MRHLPFAAAFVFGLCLALSVRTGAAAETAAPIQLELSSPDTVEPGTTLDAAVVITNRLQQPVSATLDYSVQHDATWFTSPSPDPLYGSDAALGARSWTEADSKTIAQGMLTDGRKWTAAETEYNGGHWAEAFQFIDLGKARKITRMTWEPGDANWLWKVDISASMDGKTFVPVPSLQNFDMHKKWAVPEVFPLGEPVEARFLKFRYHNDGQKSNVIRMPVAIHVYDGVADESFDMPHVGRAAASGTLTAQVPAGEKASLPLKTPALTPGAYLVMVKCKAADQTYLSWRHLAVMPLAFTPAGESRFGVNTDSGEAAGLLQRLGVGWVRFENLKWPFVSPEPGKYEFDGTDAPHVNLDQIFKAYHDHHLQILPPLLLFPKFANYPAGGKEPTYRLSPQDVAGFAEFCYQAAARYGAIQHPPEDLKSHDKLSGLGWIHIFEVWNEQNHDEYGKWGGAARFFDFYRQCAEAIRKADPTALRTPGGFSGIGVKLFEQMRNYKYPDGKTPMDFVDVMNVHFYTAQAPPELGRLNPDTARFGTTDSRTFEENLDLLQQWRDDNAPKLPIWMTETGYETAGTYGVDDHTQAAWLPRDVLLILARGVEKVMIFRDIGSGEGRWESAGIVRDDLSKKPAFFTYATLIRQLDGVKGSALQVFNGDDNVRIYAWQRGDDTLVTAWAIEGTAPLGLKLGKATLTDAFGDQQDQVDTAGLTLTTFPVYMSHCSDQAAVKRLLAAAQARRQQRAARHQQELNQTAYLFGFGAKTDVGGAFIGRYRPATAVTADEVYSDEKGYGFFPTPSTDNATVWRSDAQNRHACKLSKGLEFKFRAKPGKYHLRVGVLPFAAEGQLTVSGPVGGAQSVAVRKDKGIVELDVEVGSEPLSIQMDGYAMLSWLNLIQQLPPAPAGKGEPAQP